jgi:hypothetical protein
MAAVSASLSDRNLIGQAGLVPVLRLAERCGLGELADAHLTVASPNAAMKVASVVAGTHGQQPVERGAEDHARQNLLTRASVVP